MYKGSDRKVIKFLNCFNFLQGNITDQGRLLMQGSFNVFTEHHRGRIKDLRFKPMHRHMFLYEKSILLCKKKEESPTGLEKGVYVFKNLLQVSHASLEFFFINYTLYQNAVF